MATSAVASVMFIVRFRPNWTCFGGGIAWYEPSVRVLMVFFSALLAIGLKHLLGEGAAPDGLGPDRWPSFILALILFLRFLTGTANHLALEFSEKTTNGNVSWFLVRHAFSVCLFGVLALLICYSDSLDDFFRGIIYFSLWALISNILDMTNCFGRSRGAWVPQWLYQNLTQLAVAGFFLFFHSKHWWEYPLPFLGLKISLLIVIFIFVGIGLWDFSHQLKVVKNCKESI